MRKKGKANVVIKNIKNEEVVELVKETQMFLDFFAKYPEEKQTADACEMFYSFIDWLKEEGYYIIKVN